MTSLDGRVSRTIELTLLERESERERELERERRREGKEKRERGRERGCIGENEHEESMNPVKCPYSRVWIYIYR